MRDKLKLPREPTRGLIEADSPRGYPPRRSDFPENQLGASLKPSSFARNPRYQLDFPENQLGASLKRVHSSRQEVRHAHFPENQLGASLKLDGLDVLVHLGETSPRTNSGPH